MKERPILFNGTMIRAILDGRKTQTRRVSGLDVINAYPDRYEFIGTTSGPGSHHYAFRDKISGAQTLVKCGKGQPGDRLRVKEAAWMWCERRPNGKTKTGRDKWHYVPMREAPIHYAADHPTKPAMDVVSPDTGNTCGWRFKVGRFLPAWASRIMLEITGVRVERLNDISETDALAEGTTYLELPSNALDPLKARTWYRGLWEQINGAGSWAANPWVFVIDFKRLIG